MESTGAVALSEIIMRHLEKTGMRVERLSNDLLSVEVTGPVTYQVRVSMVLSELAGGSVVSSPDAVVGDSVAKAREAGDGHSDTQGSMWFGQAKIA